MRKRAIIVGSGINGLTAAATLSVSGWDVTVYEAMPQIGGAARTVDLGTPGFLHDVGASILPMAPLSPAFKNLGITSSIDFITPTVSVAHPRDDGPAVGLSPDLGLIGSPDQTWNRWLARSTADIGRTTRTLLSFPIPRLRDGLSAGIFGLQSLRRASAVARGFDTDEAGMLFAGLAAHAVAPLNHRAVTGVGLSLAAIAQTTGWPVVRGGTQKIVDHLADTIRANGGTIVVDAPVSTLDNVEPTDAVLLGTSAPAAAHIGGQRIGRRLRHRLSGTAPGPGVYKVDWALKGLIPWTDPLCRDAATVHLGSTLDEIERSELAMWNGRIADKPFVILAQPTVVDPSRAPAGQHTAWAYTHVPHGWQGNVTDAIERQVERFAPGFAANIIRRESSSPADLERANPNLVGGDLGMGAFGVLAMVRRPRFGHYPHRIGHGIYLASAAAAPGPGLHGMAGYRAALAAIHDSR